MEEFRPLLTTYAYNILGSIQDAQDVVQDAYTKVIGKDLDHIENKKAYLTRAVINLSINQKKRQKKIIDHYPGEWLPEPVATESADTVLNSKEVLTYSLLVLLEKLNPKQRAVFILKEAFDYEHEEIAHVLDITVENSRKLLSRAKAQLKEPAPVNDSVIGTDYLKKYLEVIRQGDTARLEQLLHDDVVVISDGGGKASAAINPLIGKRSAQAFLMGVGSKYLDGVYYKKISIEVGEVNHCPALLFFDENSILVTCQIFIIENDIIVNGFFIRNPDKLQHLQTFLKKS